MTVIVADCGSTKSDWRIIRHGSEPLSFRGPGINPSLESADKAVGKFSFLKDAVSPEENVELHYYGAGIVSGKEKDFVRECLGNMLSLASCEVCSDMTGAARALFGDGEGMAAIIGTGSNSSFCRGGVPVLSVPSGGFILGDEGSGAWIGKMLVSDYIKSIMPEDVRREFSAVCPYDYREIVREVYASGSPSRFLASFAVFAGRFKEHPYVSRILEDGFELFFTRNLMQYGCIRCFPVRMTGSVAWNFSDMIKKVAAAHGAEVDVILPSPIDALAEYHSKKREGYV